MKIFIKFILLPFLLLLCLVFLSIVFFRSSSKGRDASIKHGVSYPAVIAHRGASYLAPEETAPAYILARELGADYLEMDIQRTADGVLVAFHDDTLERTTNIEEVYPEKAQKPVQFFTLEEIKMLDAGSWFNHMFTDRARLSYTKLKILTLEEVLDIASKSGKTPGLYIECKNPDKSPGIEEELINILRKKGWFDKTKIIYQSFSEKSLLKWKNLAPEFTAVYLVDEKSEKKSGWNNLVKTARSNGMGIAPIGYLAWPWNIGRAHRAGLFVHVWTINENWQFRLIRFFGADGIFTDRADQLLKYYGRNTPLKPAEILEKNGY